MGRTYQQRSRSLRFRLRKAMVENLNAGKQYGKGANSFHPDKGAIAAWKHPSAHKPRGF